MEAAAHDPKFAAEHGISQARAAEFAHADRGKVSKLPERSKKRPKLRRVKPAKKGY